VLAAQAAEPQRALAASCGDVGRLGAAAERYRDLADGLAGALGVEELPGLLPGAVAVAVELKLGYCVDCLAQSLLPDPVIASRGFQSVVVEEHGQDIDRDPRIGVALA